MIKKIIGLIPCRLESKRLKGKALKKIDEYPLIVHTYKRALLSKKLSDIYVCTDSDKIIKELKKHKCKFIKTKKNFSNGTERIASVSKYFKADLIVDIQGDEPLLNPNDIDKVISFHIKNEKNYDIVLPYLPQKTPGGENTVKIAESKGRVLFFSRSNIPNPFKKNNIEYYKHLSIISFKPKVLYKFWKLGQSKLEQIESIELLRAIENNFKIGTFKSYSKSFSVDVKEDLDRAIKIMKNDKFRKKY
jgi:3-deoxy-manno-octulosonate cytidylyltransferase (CMP-KDO synthetase)